MTLGEIRAWYRPQPGYWFRPKRFGFGAVPVTWQGWTATGLMLALAALIGNLAEHRGTAYVMLLAPVLAGFLWLCWTKTDGAWRWRWGRE